MAFSLARSVHLLVPVGDVPPGLTIAHLQGTAGHDVPRRNTENCTDAAAALPCHATHQDDFGAPVELRAHLGCTAIVAAPRCHPPHPQHLCPRRRLLPAAT